ncbi:IS66 family insertion sequence element accessory protein TnpA [Leptospira mayottensis]|uniref:IS66 family insertion sequence element accessory protein TnpA n=1 Tax=Leptospira mayottensis TaxID=1137606 RepID=UPI0013EAD82C|nr:hypothetical protein [Leptospira mayottensis]
MKKTKIDWAKEFDDFSKSGLSQPQYCKEKGFAASKRSVYFRTMELNPGNRKVY